VQVERRRVRRCGQAERHRTCTESGAPARDLPIHFSTPKRQLLGPATLNSSPRAMMAVSVPGAKSPIIPVLFTLPSWTLKDQSHSIIGQSYWRLGAHTTSFVLPFTAVLLMVNSSRSIKSLKITIQNAM